MQYEEKNKPVNEPKIWFIELFSKVKRENPQIIKYFILIGPWIYFALVVRFGLFLLLHIPRESSLAGFIPALGIALILCVMLFPLMWKKFTAMADKAEKAVIITIILAILAIGVYLYLI